MLEKTVVFQKKNRIQTIALIKQNRNVTECDFKNY